MKINEIMELYAADSVLNRAKLETEALNTPALHAKYTNMLYTEIGSLKFLISKRKSMELRKFHFYTGKATAEEYKDSPFEHKVLKADLPYYINGDKEYRILDDKIELQTNKVKYLEECVKGINNRNWSIKSAIEMMKFQNGV